MTVETLAVKVEKLEIDLAEIKAEVAQFRRVSGAARTFGDLYGILAGTRDLMEEDFEAVKLRMNWDKFHDIQP